MSGCSAGVARTVRDGEVVGSNPATPTNTFMAEKIFNSIRDILHHTGIILHESFLALVKTPQLVAYPYLALFFIFVTGPLISSLITPFWHQVGSDAVSTTTDKIPNFIGDHIGLIAFSIFYASFVMAYFNCAMAADTISKLENKKARTFHGLQMVWAHFFKVTKYALLSILFFPLSIIAQRKKLKTSPRGVVEVLGSSFSMSMAQLSPVILTENKGFFDSIRYAADTLGKAWRENIVIKVCMYTTFIVLASVTFLPKLIESVWFDSETAHAAGWIVSAILGLASYVALRVMSTIFTTVLYHHAKHNK